MPQNSVLVTVVFILYTTQMQPIFKRHGLKYHRYADDIELHSSYAYNSSTPDDQVETARRLTDCRSIGEVRRWMALRVLKLNDEQTNIKSSSLDVRRLVLDNCRRYDFTIRPHKEFGNSHGPTCDDDRSCDCYVCCF